MSRDVFESADGVALTVDARVPVGMSAIVLPDGRSFVLAHSLDGGGRCFRLERAASVDARKTAVTTIMPGRKKKARRG